MPTFCSLAAKASIAALALLSSIAATAGPTPLLVDAGYYRIGWDNVGAHAGGRAATGGLLASAGDPFTFTTVGLTTILIGDFQASTEQFEVFLNGFSQGLSSAPTAGSSTATDLAGVSDALANLNFSRMSFDVGAGAHSIDVILRVGAGLPGSGFIALTTSTNAVPEPSTLALLTMSALAFSLIRKRT